METKGDYAGAIKLFDAIAEGNDRPFAARALLQLGFCYEKVGNAIARNKYQQLIDQFSGLQNAEIQQLIAQARNRVVALDSARSLSRSDLVTRRVWAEAGGFSDSGGFLAIAASPDGRYLAMSLPKAGASELIRFEVATGEKQILTKTTPEDDAVSGGSTAAIFSPDGRQIAFTWHGKDGYDIQLIDLDGTNRRRLYKNENGDYAFPVDWSNDGRYLLTHINRKGGTASDLALLNVADGSARVLKTFPRDPSNPTFSPDGRYVLYNWRQTEQLPPRHDIYLLDTQTSQVTPLVENPAHDFVLGWAPDGKRFLFASDRTGNVDAWLLNVAEGKPQGQPQLVKRDLGQIRRISLTRNGAFFYRVHAGMTDVWIARLDVQSGEVTLIHTEPKTWFYQAVWSLDGKSIFYNSSEDANNAFHLQMLDLTNRRVRNIFSPDPKEGSVQRFDLSPDGRQILILHNFRNGELDRITVIPVEGGEAREVYVIPKGEFSIDAAWMADGRHILFNKASDEQPQDMLWRISVAGGEPENLGIEVGHLPHIQCHPDGRQIGFTVTKGKNEVWVMENFLPPLKENQ